MRTEIEAKFRTVDPAALDRLASATRLGAAALGEAETFDELDQYLDTPDGRLAAVRWACRLRTRHGRTMISLKGPAEAAKAGDAAWLHRRPELEGPAADSLDPASWPPSAARDLVLRLADRAQLGERFRLRQRRTERPVELDGERIGTLSLDEVTIEWGGDARGRLLSVELELSGDDPTPLRPIGDALAAIPGLEPDGLTKLEHALAAIGEADPA